MSAEIVDLAARRRATAPEPDISGAMTDRQEARRFLLAALEMLDADDPVAARGRARIAIRCLDLVVPGASPNEERAELVKRARRIERAERGAETRQRNLERRDAALAAAGIVLTCSGVILPVPAGGAP
jgi:hypothetical protein